MKNKKYHTVGTPTKIAETEAKSNAH